MKPDEGKLLSRIVEGLGGSSAARYRPPPLESPWLHSCIGVLRLTIFDDKSRSRTISTVASAGSIEPRIALTELFSMSRDSFSPSEVEEDPEG